MTLIGLGGRLRAGKDAVADRLVERHGFVKIGMSDPLREHLRILNPWIKVRLREALRLRIRPGFHRAADLLERLGYVDAKTIRDLREFMQRDGTDGGRNFFGENIWVDKARAWITEELEQGEWVVVTGLRFLNEVWMVNDLDGNTAWVHRPGLAAPSGDAASHASENSVGPADFDQVIDNAGTLSDLFAKADELAAAA